MPDNVGRAGAGHDTNKAVPGFTSKIRPCAGTVGTPAVSSGQTNWSIDAIDEEGRRERPRIREQLRGRRVHPRRRRRARAPCPHEWRPRRIHRGPWNSPLRSSRSCSTRQQGAGDDRTCDSFLDQIDGQPRRDLRAGRLGEDPRRGAKVLQRLLELPLPVVGVANGPAT